MSGQSGLTLMELIVVIVVLGLAIPGMMTNLASITVRSVRSESVSDGDFLAGQLMEEIVSKRFVDFQEPRNTAIGPNNGETYPNFDDVDDFNGYSRSVAPYTVSANVTYASYNGTAWVNSTTPTEFKQITVRATRPNNLLNTTLVTVVTYLQPF
jgi:prepilin-type N-terminal cleavage/methylation domain-containing protein